MPAPLAAKAAASAKKTRPLEQALRVAPLLLVALVGIVVCLLIACGGSDIEANDDGDDTTVGCSSGGYSTDRFGLHDCADGTGYGRGKRGLAGYAGSR